MEKPLIGMPARSVRSTGRDLLALVLPGASPGVGRAAPNQWDGIGRIAASDALASIGAQSKDALSLLARRSRREQIDRLVEAPELHGCNFLASTS